MAKRGMTPAQAEKIRSAKGIEDTKLHKLRIKKGYSQNDLSVVAGIPKRTIQNYEQRRRPIDTARLDVLCALCIALDCKIEDILEDEELIKKYTLSK